MNLMIEVCKWHEYDECNWQTDCDNLFCFNEGTPSDNGMNFCCYCGKPLEEIKYNWEGEYDDEQ